VLKRGVSPKKRRRKLTWEVSAGMNKKTLEGRKGRENREGRKKGEKGGIEKAKGKVHRRKGGERRLEKEMGFTVVE